MPKSPVQKYTLIELPAISSSSSDPNHLHIPPNNDNILTKNTEPYPPDHGSAGRVRFLEPHSANHTTPTQSKSPKRVPSFESFDDLHQDGPNSVSRGLQTDISSASVIDWVIAQKSSSTADRYITQFISDMMHKSSVFFIMLVVVCINIRGERREEKKTYVYG
jgi:hypothetical protein